MPHADGRPRCAWPPPDDPLYLRYHDEEWGVPSRVDRHLFEMLVLEGAQAGLSWTTILRKREGYRAAFDSFDPEAIARYGPADVERLLADPGIVRNRLKVQSAIENARTTVALRDSGVSLGEYLWSFVDGTPIQNQFRELAELPAETEISRAMSKDMKQRGFRFVGPTVLYAHMQATGMVNDHTTDCFRWAEVAALT